MINFSRAFILDSLAHNEEEIPFEMNWIEPGEFTLGKFSGYQNLNRAMDEDSLFVSVEEFDNVITKGFW